MGRIIPKVCSLVNRKNRGEPGKPGSVKTSERDVVERYSAALSERGNADGLLPEKSPFPRPADWHIFGRGLPKPPSLNSRYTEHKERK